MQPSFLNLVSKDWGISNDFHMLFLAKLFPQLCSCHWNGNYDLFSNFVTFLWPFQQFDDLSVTFMTFLWPFQHFCDLFMNDKKSHNFMNNKMILSRSNCDLFVIFLWPFQHFNDLFVNDLKGHNFMNNKMILSRSNYNLFMNDTI